jgi:hypothetical protein
LPSRRPNLNEAIRALLEDVRERMPEFAHVQPARVLVVSGEARRASRGTVKPLTFAGGKTLDARGRRKPLVRFHGKKMLYCITLRPLFFRASTPEMRVGTVLHELYHASASFDGTLDDARRHAQLGKDFGRKLRPLVRRYLKRCPQEVLAPFAYDGEVRILQWLERPASLYVPGRATVRRLYNEAHLFLATVRMVSEAPRKEAARKRLH